MSGVDNRALSEEAISAFQAALEVLDRAVEPLEWVVTQVSFGNVLQIHGQRTGDMARLNEALTCYESALDEITQGRCGPTIGPRSRPIAQARSDT